jgi:hypothetical protein
MSQTFARLAGLRRGGRILGTMAVMMADELDPMGVVDDSAVISVEKEALEGPVGRGLPR